MSGERLHHISSNVIETDPRDAEVRLGGVREYALLHNCGLFQLRIRLSMKTFGSKRRPPPRCP